MLKFLPSRTKKKHQHSRDESGGELATESVEPSRASSWKRRSAKWLGRLLLAAVVAVVVVVAFSWWKERTLAKAAAALENGDAKYSLYLVSQFLEDNPSHSRALAIQARALVKMGYANEAIEIFEQIGAASADDMHALAQAYMMRKEWSTALGLLTRVLQITPNDADALYEAASCQSRLGAYEESLENAKRFAEQSGQTARGYLLIGFIYGYMGKNDEAAKAFQRVLKEEPEGKNLNVSPAEFFLRYGSVLMALGKPREALTPLKQSVAHQYTGEAFTLLGNAASQLGESKNAVAAWKKAVEVAPTSLSARQSLANAALLARDGEQALKWLEPIRDNKELPSSVAYVFQRAYTLLKNDEEASKWREKTDKLRREEQVLSVINRFLVSEPDSMWSRAALAHRFASEGNWNQADLIVSRLVEQAPGEPFIIELADAVRRKSKLPPITRIPVVRY